MANNFAAGTADGAEDPASSSSAGVSPLSGLASNDDAIAEAVPAARTLHERIEDLFREARRVEDQPPHARFSSAADCLRQHVYAWREYQAGTWQPWRERPVRWNMAAVFGTALGDFLEAAARRLGAITQESVSLTSREVDVHGNLDVHWPGADVWDFKCCSDYAWREVQKAPKDRHVLQLQGYLSATGEKRGALIYIKSSGIGKGKHLEWVAHEIEADPWMATELIARWVQVKKHVEAGTTPERPFTDPDCFDCTICPYRTDCWTEGG